MFSQSIRRILTFGLPILFFVFLKSSLLLTFEDTAVHDTLKQFSIFELFADGIRWNSWDQWMPLWNPFMHSGEPFYYSIIASGMLKPGMLFMAGFHQIIPQIPIYNLYLWGIALDYIIFIFGVQLFLTTQLKNWESILLGGMLCAGSGLSISLFNQVTFLNTIYFLPWILFCLWQFWYNSSHRLIFLVASLILIFISFNVYVPAYTSLFLCCGIGVFLFSCLFYGNLVPLLKIFYRRVVRVYPKWTLWQWSVFVAFLLGCAMPLFSVMFENGMIFPIARYLTNSEVNESGIGMRFVLQDLGSVARPWDLFGSFFPFTLLEFEESVMYLSSITFIGALVSLRQIHRQKVFVFWAMAILFACLSLGVKAKLSPLFYQFVPIFSFIRHMAPFIHFAGFCLLVCCMIAFDRHISDSHAHLAKPLGFSIKLKIGRIPIVFMTLMLLLIVYHVFKNIHLWRYGNMEFDSDVAKTESILCTIVVTALIYLFWLRKSWISLAVVLVLSTAEMTFSNNQRMNIGKDIVSKNLGARDRPEVLKNMHSQSWTFRRQRNWVVAPMFWQPKSHYYFYDTTVSVGESMLLRMDSAYQEDNNQFFMLKSYYQFLQTYIPDLKARYAEYNSRYHAGEFFRRDSTKSETGQFWSRQGLQVPLALLDDVGINAEKIFSSPSAVTYQVDKFEANILEISVHAPSKSELIYLDANHPGWEVSVNGTQEKLAVWKAIFKKVNIPSGESKISYRFRKVYFMIGIYCVLIGYGILFSIFLCSLKFTRINRTQQEIPTQ